MFLAVFCARMIVFRIFLTNAAKRPGGIQEQDKYRWLLLQILPVVMTDHDDILAIVTLEMQRISHRHLTTILAKERKRIQELLGKEKLLTVLDEAQSAASRLTEFFASSDGKAQRPVLRPFLLEWVEYDRYWKLIISGTGVSMKVIDEVVNSATGKIGAAAAGSEDFNRLFKNVGFFDNEKDQAKYVRRYLPAASLDDGRWGNLLERIFRWLRGRYACGVFYHIITALTDV
jgi:hypothetical protein